MSGMFYQNEIRKNKHCGYAFIDAQCPCSLLHFLITYLMCFFHPYDSDVLCCQYICHVSVSPIVHSSSYKVSVLLTINLSFSFCYCWLARSQSPTIVPPLSLFLSLSLALSLLSLIIPLPPHFHIFIFALL